MLAKNGVIIAVIFFLLTGLSQCSPAEAQQLAPGVSYRHIYNAQGPWSINILEIRLNMPSLQLKTIKARNLLFGNLQTSLMAQQRDWPGHVVVGGINADFYAKGGMPVGTQILDGKILKSPSNRAVFILSGKNKPAIEIVSLDAWLICKNRKIIQINGINRSREKDEVILYNSFRGATTHTNRWGNEITLSPINKPCVGDTIKAVVSAIAFAQGDQSIPAKGMIISGHDKAARFLKRNIFIDDTVAIVITLPPYNSSIREAIGGIPRIIRDGRVSIELEGQNIRESFATTRHPRTAIGFNQDSTKLFMVTVDGRQPGHSVGMRLDELANFMLKLGCFQAINLDGGGSTTMLVGTRVVNRPSDAAGERAVANALLVISTAPEDSLRGLKDFLTSLRVKKNE